MDLLYLQIQYKKSKFLHFSKKKLKYFYLVPRRHFTKRKLYLTYFIVKSFLFTKCYLQSSFSTNRTNMSCQRSWLSSNNKIKKSIKSVYEFDKIRHNNACALLQWILYDFLHWCLCSYKQIKIQIRQYYLVFFYDKNF